MTSEQSGTGVAGSSSSIPLWLSISPFFNRDIYMRVQALLITTIRAFTAIAISTIAVSNRATISSTMTTQWKSGRASSRASPSAYYAFLLFYAPRLFSFFLFLPPRTCASLGTDTDYVRGQLAKYTDELLSLGVDGLRLDAAKRMSSLSNWNIFNT